MDSEKVKTLEDRLEIIKSKLSSNLNYTGFPGDCNKAVDKIIKRIKSSTNTHPKFHALGFLDNEGLNISWETIKKLLDLRYCDLIINFPTSNVKRAFGQPDNYNKGKLNDFFGCEIKKVVSSPDELLSFYVNKITSAKKDCCVTQIKINTGITYHYHLLIVTKNAPFTNYIKSLKAEVEHNSANTVEQIISIIKGKQSTLANFQS